MKCTPWSEIYVKTIPYLANHPIIDPCAPTGQLIFNHHDILISSFNIVRHRHKIEMYNRVSSYCIEFFLLGLGMIPPFTERFNLSSHMFQLMQIIAFVVWAPRYPQIHACASTNILFFISNVSSGIHTPFLIKMLLRDAAVLLTATPLFHPSTDIWNPDCVTVTLLD